MNLKKKLIAVSLSLEAINVASAREKSIWPGHPSTLHLWWARRPLAAAWSVIFAQMVDHPLEYLEDPSASVHDSQWVFALFRMDMSDQVSNQMAMEQSRDLAYRLYNSCERTGLADEVRNYNALVIAWPDLVKLSQSEKTQISGRFADQEML